MIHLNKLLPLFSLFLLMISAGFSSDKKAVVFPAHDMRILTVNFSHDGTRLLTGAEDGLVRIWSFPEILFQGEFLVHHGWVYEARFLPGDSTVISAGRDEQVVIYDLDQRKVVSKNQAHEGAARSVAVGGASKMVVSSGFGGSLVLWEGLDSLNSISWQAHALPVCDVSISPDGTRVVSGSRDKKVRVWSLPERSMIGQLDGHDHEVKSVRFSPDGSMIASAGFDKTVRLWDANQYACVKVFEGHSGNIHSLAFHPSRPYLVSGGDDALLHVWDLQKMVLHSVFELPTGTRSIAFSPDGKFLVAAKANGCFRVISQEELKIP